MKSKFKKFLASFGILSTMIVVPSAIIASTVNMKEANAFFGKKTEMIWIQKGQKHVDGNDYKTSHDGRVWERERETIFEVVMKYFEEGLLKQE